MSLVKFLCLLYIEVSLATLTVTTIREHKFCPGICVILRFCTNGKHLGHKGSQRDDTGKKNYVPWKKIHVPWKKYLQPLEKKFRLLAVWSCGPLVLWSCGPGAVVLWSSGPVVLWCSGAVVLWSSGPVVV